MAAALENTSSSSIRVVQCSFCQESHSSSSALRDHLMICGNKTDQCPNCRKFIRRAVFAYHYENKCAHLEETDASTPRSGNSSSHRPSTKSTKPLMKENDIDNDDQENPSDYNSSNSRSNKSKRILSATSNKRDSLDIIECEFCQNRCVRSDYDKHKDICLQNPIRLEKKRQRTSSTSDKARPSTNERGRSSDIVRIPCEFCDEQIDLRTWSIHVQNCREKETRRLEARAEMINREPVPEKLPCEHCQELFPYGRLRTHELVCRKNPEYIDPAVRLTNTQPVTTVGLSNGSFKSKRDPTLSSPYSSLPSSLASAYNISPQSKDIVDRIDAQERGSKLQNGSFTSSLTVDIQPNAELLRLRGDDTSAFTVSGRQPPKQHRASDGSGSQLINSSRDISAYNTMSWLSTDRLSSGTQSLSRRTRSASLERVSRDRQLEERRSMPPRANSPSIPSLRPSSVSRNSPDARGSYRSNAINRHLIDNNVIFNSPREEDQKYQPRLNQAERSVTHNNRSKWKSSYCNPVPWK